MLGTVTLESALRSSVFLLMDERRRLEQELADMEQKMMAARTGAEVSTLDERMAATRQALRALEQEQEAQRQAERRAAAEAAARAARERLTGHARALADAHDSKLEALARAEAHMAAAVAAINEALQWEAAERAAATAMASEMNVKTTPLNFSPTEFVRRLAGGLCARIAEIAACRMGRLGALTLPNHSLFPTSETWRDREARATAPSVAMLLEHAESNEAEAA
jgi:hypothetical protein